MSESLAANIDPADYVSVVRDWLIPEAVQRLVAALANMAPKQVRQAISDQGFQETLDIVLETPDTTPESLRNHLLNQRDWRPIALALTALRCLEDDCREGAYEKAMPTATRDVVIAALQWQIELQQS